MNSKTVRKRHTPIKLTATTPVKDVYQEIVSYTSQNEFRGMIHEARERYFERPLRIDERVSDRLEVFFLEWVIFDYRKRRHTPTLFERFLKSRPFDQDTLHALEEFEKGRNSFFRVLQAEKNEPNILTLSLVELGRETDGRLEVTLNGNLNISVDCLLDGRLVQWNGEHCFLGVFRIFEPQQANEISADLRAIRQQYDDDCHWRLFVAELKSLLTCDLEAKHRIDDLLHDLANGSPLTPDSLVCSYILSRLAANDTQNAIRWAEEALADYPDSQSVKMTLVDCYMRDDRNHDALVLLEDCLRHNPDDVKPRIRTSDCLIRLERYVEARKVLEPALELKANENYPFIQARVGICYLREGDYERGKILMRESIAGKPQSTEIYVMNATALLGFDDFQEMMIYTEAGLEIDPNNQFLLMIHALCLEGIKDYERALSTLDRYARVIQQRPTSNLLKRTAMLAVRLGRYTRAIRAYEQCLRLDSNDIEASTRLVELMRLKGWVHQAEPIWHNLQRRNANHPDVLALAQGKSLFAESSALPEANETTG